MSYQSYLHFNCHICFCNQTASENLKTLYIIEMPVCSQRKDLKKQTNPVQEFSAAAVTVQSTRDLKHQIREQTL